MNSTGPPIADVSNNIILAATIGSAMELFLMHPMAFIISIFNFSLIFNTKLLHPNLKIILLTQSATIASFALSRIAYVAYKFISEDMFYFGLFPIQTFGIFTNFLRNYIMHALLLERIVATIFFRTYGQFDNKCPILAFCSIGISIVFSFLQCFYQNGTLRFTDFLNILFHSLFTLLTLSEFVIILMLYTFNWKFYRFQQTLPLNQRYQLSENIRTAKQLMPTFFFHFAIICLNSSTQFVQYFHVIDSPQMISFYILWMILISGILSSLIELTVITHHPLLRRKAMNWLRIITQLRSANAVEDSGHTQKHQQMANLNGQTLISVSESESHFKMLEQLWK